MQAIREVSLRWVDNDFSPGQPSLHTWDWSDMLGLRHTNVEVVSHRTTPRPPLRDLAETADLVLMNSQRVEHILILPNGAVELGWPGCVALTFPPQLVSMTDGGAEAKDDRGAAYNLAFFDRRSY